MDRSQRKELLEAIGFVALIASLVFVGIETRNSAEQARLANQTLQNDSWENVMALMNDLQQVLYSDAEFHRIYVLGEKSPSELSVDEWSRFTQFEYPRMGTWEYLYLGRLENSMSPGIWAAFEGFFLSTVCMKGHRRFFDENRNAHSPQFMNYLDTEVFPECSPQ